jgi:hypothetical protein
MRNQQIASSQFTSDDHGSFATSGGTEQFDIEGIGKSSSGIEQARHSEGT